MFYEYDVTSPAGTTSVAPSEVTARLNKGVITRVAVHFPPGCAGRVRTAADRFEGQVWPSNPDVGFKGDDDIIAWQESYRLDDEPLFFTLRAWSPDARFSHTVTWRFELLPLEEAEAALGQRGLLGKIADFLGIGG